MEPSPKDLLGEHFADVVLELAPDGIAVTDELGRILYANGRFERMFGIDRDLLIGHTVEMLLPDRLHAVHRAHRHDWERAPTARPMGAGGTLWGRHADGTEIPLEVALSPVSTGQGLRTIMTVRMVDDPRAADSSGERTLEAFGEHVATVLNDEVVQRLFSASLILHGVCPDAAPGVADEVHEAIAQLDLAIGCLHDVALDVLRPHRDAAHDLVLGRAGDDDDEAPATQASGLTVEYEIDADDRLIGVGGSWAEFAQDNDAPELAAPELGRSIWSYVDGDDVQDLWRLLLARVRAERTDTRIPFRCDGPDVRRWFEMILSPDDADSVHFRSVLIVEAPRPDIVLLDRWAHRMSDATPLVVCSWCGRGHDGSRWRDLEEVVRDRRLLEQPDLPPLDHGVCPTCVALITQRGAGAGAGAGETPAR